MFKKIREYLEYRKNKKIAKREFAKMATTTLPVVNNAIEKIKVNNVRIMEILTYMLSLTPEEIQKILVHSVVETIPDDKE